MIIAKMGGCMRFEWNHCKLARDRPDSSRRQLHTVILHPHEGTGFHIDQEKEDGLSLQFHGAESIPRVKQVLRVIGETMRPTGAAIPFTSLRFTTPISNNSLSSL